MKRGVFLKVSKFLISTLFAALLIFTGAFGFPSAEASGTQTGDELKDYNDLKWDASEIVEGNEGLVKDGDVEQQDWVIETTEYGNPSVVRDVILYPHDTIDIFPNNSSRTTHYSATQSTSFKSEFNFAVGVNVDLPQLNFKFNGQLGITGSKSHSFTRVISQDVPPYSGLIVHKLYREFAVPTYKVIKYSGSMGMPDERRYVGITTVYLPVGITVVDYKM